MMLTFRWRIIELVLEERCAEISLEAAMGCWRWKVSCGSKLETFGRWSWRNDIGSRLPRATSFPERNKQNTVKYFKDVKGFFAMVLVINYKRIYRRILSLGFTQLLYNWKNNSITIFYHVYNIILREFRVSKFLSISAFRYILKFFEIFQL